VTPDSSGAAAYDQLGFQRAVESDEVFRQLVLARIIEPTSKQDSLRVLAEVGVDAVSYATLKRRLRTYADDAWRRPPRRRRARRTPSSGLRRWCATTSRPCIPRLTQVTCSASRGFPITPSGAADHHRSADRRLGVPVDGRGVRGQPCPVPPP